MENKDFKIMINDTKVDDLYLSTAILFEDNMLTKEGSTILEQYAVVKSAFDNFEKIIKNMFENAMEDNNIKTISTDVVTISKTAPTVRETFDTKKFKEDYEGLYNDYVKLSDVKGSIRFNLKKNVKKE